jgi:phenylacetate-CoA ligase
MTAIEAARAGTAPRRAPAGAACAHRRHAVLTRRKNRAGRATAAAPAAYIGHGCRDGRAPPTPRPNLAAARPAPAGIAIDVSIATTPSTFAAWRPPPGAPSWDPWALWSRASLELDARAAAAAPAAAIERRQRERLTRLLDGAAAGSAFYRERLAGRDPATTALADLPAIDKTELMRRFADWVTDPALTLDGLRRFVADPAQIGRPYLGRYTVWESSGSRGQPGLFVQDEAALAVYDVLEATRRTPVDPLARWLDPCFLSERIAFVGAIGGHFASHVSVERLRRLTPWLTRGWHSLSILQPLPDLCAALDALQPSIVATYPTAATLLAGERHAGRLHIAPSEVWTGGETLGPAARAEIAQAFGATVRDSYGASEFLPIAWECAQGALHVNADWVVLEPVDAQGRAVPPGVRSHTTLLTNLANHVQPLIRVDLGDQTRWRPGPCRCGSALPVIEVHGRCDDLLRLPGRAGGTVALLPLALSTVLEDEAGVFDFLLEQTGASTLRLHVATGGGLGQDAVRRAGRVLRDFAARQGVTGLRLRVEACAQLPLARRGRSGKLQRIVAQRAAA